MDPLISAPLVSIVMINWNRKEVLRHVLKMLAGQTYKNREIIICDNHSTDGAPDMVAAEFPGVRLIRAGANMGIAGYNVALSHSAGDLIVILDNDSFLEDEGISKIVGKFETYPRLGALGCKVYNFYSGQIHHWHPRFRGDNAPPEGIESPLFNGCAAAARRGVLRQVGFYPEEFFLYENERDLCTRIIDAGYEVRYFTDIYGYHMVAPEGRSSERLIYYAKRNKIWYFWKYLPVPVAVLRTAAAISGSLVEALKNGNVRSQIRPLLDAFRGLPRVLRHRKPIRKASVPKVLY
jgi:GT2 family glycosyltransferase